MSASSPSVAAACPNYPFEDKCGGVTGVLSTPTPNIGMQLECHIKRARTVPATTKQSL